MKWFLNVVFIYIVKYVYSKSIENFQQNDSGDVNKFLGKILHADKFNELADRIAERAVQKLKDYQKPQLTAKFDKKRGAYRSKMKTLLNDAVNYSYEKSRGAKHKHGKIDVNTVLKKTVLPLSDLKLRYVNLKNKHSRATQRMKKTDDNNDGEHKGDENIPRDLKTLAKDIRLDFDENIKTLSDENFENPFGLGKTVSWNKIHSKETTSKERKFRSKADSRQLGDNVSSEKENTYSGTTRTEGDKQFALVESPDYKEYHEQLANVAI